MNIIKRVARKLGFDIVRYSTPALPKKKPQTPNQKPVLSVKLASEALESVGRNLDTPLFTYYTRPEKSSPVMEEAENLWWNSHGKLIEKVWVLSESVNALYRNDYVLKAAAFFKKENKNAKILDLGCGSGWFGRMIADEDLEYYGMDFSSTQIEIANNEKEKSRNKKQLNYYCLSDIKKIEKLNEITGVVIHAFLHHLYWDELNVLFKELATILPNGCKFFIVEPVYPDPTNQKNESGSLSKISESFIINYRNYLTTFKTELIAKGLYDTKTEDELNEVFLESSRNGFFLSPKEVPFKLTEFKSFLNKYVSIENIFHCGVVDLETAQFIDRIKSKKEQDYYKEQLFPLANSIDKFLLSTDYFETNQNNYLFTAFECTLNK